jgi:hypothetical protein
MGGAVLHNALKCSVVGLYSRTFIARHVLVSKAHPGNGARGELYVQPAQAPGLGDEGGEGWSERT